VLGVDDFFGAALGDFFEGLIAPGGFEDYGGIREEAGGGEIVDGADVEIGEEGGGLGWNLRERREEYMQDDG
jgi:hypothetical protein